MSRHGGKSAELFASQRALEENIKERTASIVTSRDIAVGKKVKAYGFIYNVVGFAHDLWVMVTPTKKPKSKPFSIYPGDITEVF